MAYREIADSEIDRNSPVTEPLATAWRDNPKGIAQRDTGAPRVKPNSIESLTTPGSGTWTVPDGVTRVKYRMIGGGGEAEDTQNGEDGEDTTLNDGSTTYVAGGGAGGVTGGAGGAGGTASGGALNVRGGSGGSGGGGAAPVFHTQYGTGGDGPGVAGGGGAYIEGTIEVSPGDSLAYNVGAGGSTFGGGDDGLQGLIILEY